MNYENQQPSNNNHNNDPEGLLPGQPEHPTGMGNTEQTLDAAINVATDITQTEAGRRIGEFNDDAARHIADALGTAGLSDTVKPPRGRGMLAGIRRKLSR